MRFVKTVSGFALLGLAVMVQAAMVQATAPALAQSGPIRIGEINSYKAMAANNEPYRKGWELALEQINAAGGVLGRKLEVVYRDDNANPGEAVRVAEELVSREKVDLIAGSVLSHVGLALTDYAKNRKIVYFASAPLTDKIIWQNGNRYTFRLRVSTYTHAAMLVPEAAKLKKKRWAFVYPNYELGQSAVESFKTLLKQAQPDVEFVGEQAPPLGKIEAGATVQALDAMKPDAIFNVLFGADLAKFVREGNTRGLFQGREVFSLLTGEPEYLDPLGDEAPVNWFVTGYPWYSIKTPEHDAFLEAYRKRWNDYPRIGSVIGYTMIQGIAAAIKKAGSTDTEKLVGALEGLGFGTPFGPVSFRPQDHQSTMGLYIGRIGLKDGKGIMSSFTYVDGAGYQPSDADVAKWRPAN